jgi:hypothetical protein
VIDSIEFSLMNAKVRKAAYPNLPRGKPLLTSPEGRDKKRVHNVEVIGEKT